jgi:signal transduction histidine kinase
MIAGVLSVVLLAMAAQIAGVPVEVTPIGYLLTATLFAIAITRFGYFDVVPLASDSIVEELGAGVLVYDPAGQVLDANTTATEILGVDCTPSTDVHEVIEQAGVVESSTDNGEVLATLEESLDGKEFSTTVEGQQRRIAVSVSAVTDSGGTVVGNRLLLYDVTEQYHREQRLERQKAQLDQFASFVSHDLRNPLGIARTYLDFARESGDNDDFEAVEEALERMDTMIEDLLTMARADSIVDETESVAVSGLADDAWGTVQTDGATLKKETTDTIVEADRDLLRNVFENVFRNAREHNDGPLTVTVGSLEDDSGFFIADDGTGIPEEKRDEALEQGYSTSEEGSGLGLSIVGGIVDAHGWELAITEARDAGARFEFRTGK